MFKGNNKETRRALVDVSVFHVSIKDKQDVDINFFGL